MNDEARIPAIALIDGEHYPDVTLDALADLESGGYRLLALVFLGGTEKVADVGRFSYRGLPIYSGSGQVEDLRRAISEQPARVVLDLSDEPVVGYRERFRLASESLARGMDYLGADFEFSSPRRPFVCDKPSIGVWGAGKRVGKTALSGFISGYLAPRGTRVCVVTMGRGGPPEPELLDDPAGIDDDYLRALVARGRHAASDHFEDAMTGGAVAVGCRRCGGGLAGEPFFSNVIEGARVACRLDADAVIFEGSGASIPPVGVDSALLAVSALQPGENVLSYLGPYRLLLSDLVVVTMCEEFLLSSDKLRELIDGILSINPWVKIVKTVFRPRPMGNIQGSKVFLTSTALGQAVEIQARYLEERYGARVVGTSGHLADRRRLEEDLSRAAGAEVMVTELKAAGVEVVSAAASGMGIPTVYLDNVPLAVEGSLEEEIDRLVALATERKGTRAEERE